MAYQNGGWYNGQQYWNGSLGPKGVIINPNQQGHAGGGGSGGSSSSPGASTYTPPPPPPPPPPQTNNPYDPNKRNSSTMTPNFSTPQTSGASASVVPQTKAIPQTPAPKSSIPQTPMPPHKDSVAAALSNRTQSVSTKTVNAVDPGIATATAKAIQNGANPKALATAQHFLGAKDYIGYCESFVEKVTGEGWKGTSAVDAWNNQKSQAVQGLQGVKPGDAVYFAGDASNGYNGHTGIYAGNGQFVSATDNGIQQYDLGAWIKSTGQKLLGYVPQVAGGIGGAVSGAIGDIGQGINDMINPSGNTASVNPSQMSPQQILTQFKSMMTPDQINQVQNLISKSTSSSDAAPRVLSALGVPTGPVPKRTIISKLKKKQNVEDSNA